MVDTLIEDCHKLPSHDVRISLLKGDKKNFLHLIVITFAKKVRTLVQVSIFTDLLRSDLSDVDVMSGMKRHSDDEEDVGVTTFK
jgi:hypothetical protein